jgi:hypothetical protein
MSWQTHEVYYFCGRRFEKYGCQEQRSWICRCRFHFGCFARFRIPREATHFLRVCCPRVESGMLIRNWAAKNFKPLFLLRVKRLLENTDYVTASQSYETYWRHKYVTFEILTAVVMKVAFIWDITPCGPYVSRCFRGMYHLHLQGRKLPSKKPRQQTQFQTLAKLPTEWESRFTAPIAS